MTLWEHKAALSCAAFAAGIVLYTVSCDSHGAARSVVTLQSHTPWTIVRCDRFAGVKATAVFNTLIWTPGGWPLWRVVCVYKTEA